MSKFLRYNDWGKVSPLQWLSKLYPLQRLRQFIRFDGWAKFLRCNGCARSSASMVEEFVQPRSTRNSSTTEKVLRTPIVDCSTRLQDTYYCRGKKSECWPSLDLLRGKGCSTLTSRWPCRQFLLPCTKHSLFLLLPGVLCCNAHKFFVTSPFRELSPGNQG